jgi:RNA polymerase sigma factor (TIGR02999 family)
LPGNSAESHVTHLLAAISCGDPAAGDELLPLIYDQLRSIARQRMAAEAPGHTLQPTALVHEAYLRLLGETDPTWDSRGHFYAAASEAMRRILVEHARRRKAIKRGGGRQRVDLDEVEITLEDESVDVLALDLALDELKKRDERMHDIAMLRHFCGLTNEQTALALGSSTRTVRREWSYARLWLHESMTKGPARAAHEGNGGD